MENLKRSSSVFDEGLGFPVTSLLISPFQRWNECVGINGGCVDSLNYFLFCIFLGALLVVHLINHLHLVIKAETNCVMTTMFYQIGQTLKCNGMASFIITTVLGNWGIAKLHDERRSVSLQSAFLWFVFMQSGNGGREGIYYYVD